tara:strand:+ start:965 stop:1351 length:387 start_codon:yes stop_codon:yes gene_type:complete
MKTIFSLLSLLLLSSYIQSSEIIVKTFDIENRNQKYSFVSARASSLANRIIRDNAYLFYVDPSQDSLPLKNCWKSYLINKKIKIDVIENTHKLVRKTSSQYVFEVYFDPSKIKVIGVNRRAFLNSCNK